MVHDNSWLSVVWERGQVLGSTRRGCRGSVQVMETGRGRLQGRGLIERSCLEVKFVKEDVEKASHFLPKRYTIDPKPCRFLDMFTTVAQHHRKQMVPKMLDLHFVSRRISFSWMFRHAWVYVCVSSCHFRAQSCQPDFRVRECGGQDFCFRKSLRRGRRSLRAEVCELEWQ